MLLLPTAATLFAIRELSGLLTMLVEVHREHMGRLLGEATMCFRSLCSREATMQSMLIESASEPTWRPSIGVVQSLDPHSKKWASPCGYNRKLGLM